jgi:hypothetical protein
MVIEMHSISQPLSLRSCSEKERPELEGLHQSPFLGAVVLLGAAVLSTTRGAPGTTGPGPRRQARRGSKARLGLC